MLPPLLVFRSTNGRTFLSLLPPPRGFPIDGSVQVVQRLTMLTDNRLVPTVNWTAENPACLYLKRGTCEFAIGFPDRPLPEGYETLGSEFAIAADGGSLTRAAESDLRLGPATSSGESSSLIT